MKNSSLSSLKSANKSAGKLPAPAEVKQITAPVQMANAKESKAESFEPANEPKSSPSNVLYKARGLYAFKAETADDLAFEKGDIISVTSQIDENWWSGEIVSEDGSTRKGIFPSNYVEKIDGNSDDKPHGIPTAALGAEALSQMKAVLPGDGLADITAAITGVKLKHKSSEPAKKSEPVVEAVGACSTCGCDEFSPNAFKKGHCNMCFHKH